MDKLFYFLLLIGVVVYCNSENSEKNDPEKRTYENSYESSSHRSSSSSSRDAYLSVENDPYYNNSLSTGAVPYTNSESYYSNESSITVSTSYNSNCDVIVIIKSGGNIVRNTYIKAGGDFTFNLPNDSYQVFFYAGKGWNPNKVMPNGLRGGFVANESYSKDSPTSLHYEGLTYELTPRTNGNFSTQHSTANEIF